MKQEATPQKKKWVVIVAIIAALLLIAGGVVAAIFLLNGQQDQPGEQTVQSDLYWNLDKVTFTENSETGLSTRERAEDGLYHFRFATKGKLVELTTADAQIVNFIDTMEVMGLVFDADGLIVDAVTVEMIATEVAKDYFVKSVDGAALQLNSSPAMNGMDVDLVIPEDAYIMDGRADSETAGQPIELDVMDTVWVYADMDGKVTDVFLSSRPADSEFYVRVNKMYANGATTRVPDENGVYTIPFAVNGQIVDLKCKDVELVSFIDSGTDSKLHFGLIFDEEGYIIDTMTGAEALRGVMAANVFHVTEINGQDVTLTRKLPGNNQGQEVKIKVTEDTLIFTTDNRCFFDHIGQLVDELIINDRVIAYTDSKGNALAIDILIRMVESEMYFNETVKYSSVNKETTRVPDENGYYVFKMACNGKKVTLKTKSKEVASKVDSYSNQMMGLKLDGTIIKDACEPFCVAGWNATSKLYLGATMGSVVTLNSRYTIANYSINYVLAEGCKIYDVTGDYGVKYGSETELQVGDHVYGVRNPYGDLAYVFVTKRYREGLKLYYNTWRKYDTAKEVTTREVDAEGYYVYDLLLDGKLVQGKTKSKEMADFIDKQLSPFVSLKINSSGIITKAAFAESYHPYAMKRTNYHYIASIDWENRTFCTYYYSNGKRVEADQNLPMTDDCIIRNNSVVFNEARGEKTRLKVDDRVQSFQTADTGEIYAIYVLERTVNSPIYWHVQRQYNDTLKETTRTPDADGYYHIELIADGKIHQLKTKKKAVIDEIDRMSWGFCLIREGNVIVNVVTYPRSVNYSKSPIDNYTVTKIEGNKYTIEKASTGDKQVLTIPKSCPIYDVSAYAKVKGAKVKIGLGDVIKTYTNKDDKLTLVLVTSPCVREKGFISVCPHCNEEVKWTAYNGTTPVGVVGHYYLTHDRTMNQRVVGAKGEEKRSEMVLDLNGKVLTGSKGSLGRGFLVYGDLTVLDTVGGGGITGSGSGWGGALMVRETGTITLMDGTYTYNADPELTSAEGGIVWMAEESVLNIHEGVKIQNGRTIGNGGGIFAQGNATVNMLGGEISGSTATLNGGNIYAKGTVTLNLKGGTIKDGSADNGDNVFSASKKVTLNVDGTVIDGGISAPVDMDAYCDHCKQVVTFAPFEGSFTDPKGHYYLFSNHTSAQIPVGYGVPTKPTEPEDTTDAEAMAAYAEAMAAYDQAVAERPAKNAEFDVVLNLNGNRLTGTTRNFITYADLSIVDSVGTGEMIAKGTAGWGGNALVRDGSVLSIYGGTMKLAEDHAQIPQGGNIRVYADATVNLYGGKIIGGVATDKGGVLYLDDSAFNLYGGEISGGTATQGNALFAGNGSRVTLNGAGTVGGDIFIGGTCTVAAAGKLMLPDGLTLDPGAKLDITEMTSDSRILLTASGEFTTARDDVADFAVCFTSTDDTLVIKPTGNNTLKMADAAAVDIVQYCPHCQTEATFVAFDGVFTDPQGHYYLFTDANVAAQIAIGKSVTAPTAPTAPTTAEPVAPVEPTAPADPTDTVAMEAYEAAMAEYQTQKAAYDTAKAAYDAEQAEYQAKLAEYQTKLDAYNAAIALNQTTDIVLDLRGKTMTSGTRNFLLYSKLSVMDSVGTGKMVAKGMAAWGGNVLMSKDTAVLNIYGGTWMPSEDALVKTEGGNIRAYQDATINIYGGKVIGGVSSGNGGILYLDDAALNLYGGEISGGTAVKGAAVYAANGSRAVLDGAATIGGDIYVSNTSTIAAKGDLKLTELLDLTSGAKLDITNMTSGASILVRANGVFTTERNDVADLASCFSVEDGYETVKPEGNALWTDLKLEEMVAREKAKAAAIQALDPATVVAGNTCPMCGATNVTWTKMTTGISGATSNRHVYIDGQLGTAQEPMKTFNILQSDNNGRTLCLALVNADVHTTGRFHIRKGDTMNIMGTGSITSDGTLLGGADKDVGLFTMIDTDSTLNLYGGNYTYTGASVGSGADPIYALLSVRNAGATVNIYNDVCLGNEVLDNTRAYYNVFMQGTLNMFGGTIRNGVTAKAGYGGNIHLGTGAYLNMYDGLITGGQYVAGTTEKTNGGNIRSNGNISMYGGTISGGKAVNRGGNIMMYINSTLHIEGNALITEGIAATGGNIGNYDGHVVSITMDGGTVSKGTSTVTAAADTSYIGGGNFYIWSGADLTFNINGGLVTEGVAAASGGNILLRNPNATLNIGANATISNGSAAIYGGNICMFNACKLNTEGTITGGTAAGGGNISAGFNAGTAPVITVNGGVISDGESTSATNFGGNIRLWNSTLIVNDGYIYGGKSHATAGHRHGANIAAMSGAANKPVTVTINGGHISGDIKLVNRASAAPVTATITGKPEIVKALTLADGVTVVNATHNGLYLELGAKVNVNGMLPEAKVEISAATPGVFTTDGVDATAVKDCFTPDVAGETIELTEAKVLQLVAAPVTP